MRINPNSTIHQIALLVPGSTDLFQQEGIDFRSGAERTLEEACIDADLSVDYLSRRLDSLAESDSQQPARNWHIEPLSVLTAHVVNVHHAYARHEMPRLSRQALMLTRTHGERYPELARIEVLLRAMIREFGVHMLTEEQTIFPYIVQLEAADEESEVSPQSPTGTDESPLRNLMAEHDSAVEMLRELSYLTNDFTPPVEADQMLARFYSALDAFEADMQDHIELEDNVLFPRALELEMYSRPAAVTSRGSDL
jgi:regulator of cell morphogenesis and NO signaling